eukprot:scaffold276645_cov14-Tisochrysis_lutea.AAC.1
MSNYDFTSFEVELQQRILNELLLTTLMQIYDKGQVFIKNTATKRSYSAAKMDKAFSDAGAYQAAAAWQQ